ncbi:MAG: pirin family protein [Chitinophagales bacterium]|jgi:redox-sensitive bicupin YhaK (pirin superfamily)|nr:pirin family protein [Chitinophagales bacterium]
MKTVIHKAESRGAADHGWLKAKHTFSFANYYDPSRIHFGVLRVLNDDWVAPTMGFGMHPHDNMEIITIPLEGALRHRDSMGNEGVIEKNEVQVMSAGTGVYHSEHNASSERPVSLLQIWVMPNAKNVEPRYMQKRFDAADRQNQWQTIVSPDKSGLWIHQDTWFSLGDFSKENTITYTLNKASNGVYLFVIDGSIEVGGETLSKRDGMGINDVNEVTIKAFSDAQVLLMEVPMGL